MVGVYGPMVSVDYCGILIIKRDIVTPHQIEQEKFMVLNTKLETLLISLSFGSD